MWRILEKWREKDESTRQMVALVGAGIITFIIAGIWVTVFFRDTKNNLASVSDSTKEIKNEIKNGPIDSITEATSKFWVSITDQFKQVGDSFKDLENMASSTNSIAETGETNESDFATTSPSEIPSDNSSEI